MAASLSIDKMKREKTNPAQRGIRWGARSGAGRRVEKEYQQRRQLGSDGASGLSTASNCSLASGTNALSCARDLRNRDHERIKGGIRSLPLCLG